MNNQPIASKDIEKAAYDILKQSKAFGVYPTPVDQIVRFSDLTVDAGGSFHNIPNHFISKQIDQARRLVTKIFGAMDRRKKIIYLNPSLLEVKRNFVKLHEVGHDRLPWQKATFDYIEDEKTLCAETKEVFEAEANFFASAVLFQMERFDDLAGTLPLEIKSARYLSKHFGSSVHAAIRRYVLTINKRCALLVLNTDPKNRQTLSMRDYFQSPLFTREFGEISLPGQFDLAWPFVQDYFIGKVAIDAPAPLPLTFDNDTHDFEYQYFYNRWNVFVFIMPKGEKIKSRTSIIIGA